MRWLARVLCLAAAISIAVAVAVVPDAVGADQTSCQPGSGPPGPDPSVAGGVNIHVTATNSVVWCSAQTIEANSDVPKDTNYPLRSTAQSPSDNPISSDAISVSGLLTLAGLNPASVDHLEIMRLSGSWSTLTNADLVDPSTQFQNGLKPIFWFDGSETKYSRPLRSPSDTNGNDQIVAQNGNALDVYVYSGPVLTVSANATPSHAAVNQLVTFTAQVTDATAADGSLRYTWTFQDGATATGASITHSYAVAGLWRPTVTVQGQTNDSGGASQISVTVGSVPSGPKPKPGKPGGSNPRHDAHVGGPTHSHGTTGNTSPTNKKSGSTVSTTSNTTSSTTTTSTTTTTTSPATTAPHRAATNHHAAAQRRRAASHQRVQPQPSPGGTVVDGRLIADVVPISATQLAQESSQQPAQAHAPSARAGGGSITPLGGIAGGCAIVVLLGSGAGVELRSRRRAVNPVRTA